VPPSCPTQLHGDVETTSVKKCKGVRAWDNFAIE
jgi:hypothetical protein